MRYIFLAVFFLSLSCSHAKKQADGSTPANPKASRIEFQFTSESREDIDSLRQAFATDSFYQADSVIQMEKSLWALAIRTRDSLHVSNEGNDSTINLLSQKLTPIAARYHCELTGFANL
jgi:hypothetical protein